MKAAFWTALGICLFAFVGVVIAGGPEAVSGYFNTTLFPPNFKIMLMERYDAEQNQIEYLEITSQDEREIRINKIVVNNRCDVKEKAGGGNISDPMKLGDSFKIVTKVSIFNLCGNIVKVRFETDHGNPEYDIKPIGE